MLDRKNKHFMIITAISNRKTLSVLIISAAITLYHHRQLQSVIRTVTNDTGFGNFMRKFHTLNKVIFARTMSSDSEKLTATEFEVFGRVQGVFFRKYTEKQAKSLGLRGWCMNTHSGTVQGVLEGAPSKVQEMKEWLRKTGSPQSRIDKAVFTNERMIPKYTFESFSVKR